MIVMQILVPLKHVVGIMTYLQRRMLRGHALMTTTLDLVPGVPVQTIWAIQSRIQRVKELKESMTVPTAAVL